MVTLQTDVKTQQTPVAGIFAYVLVSAVLSIISIVLVTVGLTLSIGTLIIWIGLPLLIATFALIRGIGGIERSLARQLLGTAIAEPRTRHTRGIWQSALAALLDPQIWKNLLYIVVKVPVSLVVLVVTVAMVGASLGLMLLPLGYVIATFVLAVLGVHVPDTSPAALAPIEIPITGQFDPLMLGKSLLFAGIGVALWFVVRTAVRGLGAFCGALARGLLGASTNA